MSSLLEQAIIDANLLREAAIQNAKNIVLETQKLEENRAQLERIYGIAGLDAKQGENPVQLVADWLIKDFGKRTLTDEQELLFEEAKKDYAAGNYNSALEKIFKLSDSR